MAKNKNDDCRKATLATRRANWDGMSESAKSATTRPGSNKK